METALVDLCLELELRIEKLEEALRKISKSMTHGEVLTWEMTSQDINKMRADVKEIAEAALKGE